MLQNVKKLKGYKLEALDGEIGRVKDFYFDDQRWTIRIFVADTVSWLPGKQVLISPHAVKKVREVEEILDIALTKNRVEAGPLIDLDKAVSSQFEIDYHRYYGWPPYWAGTNPSGDSVYPGRFSPQTNSVAPGLPPKGGK